MCVAIYKPAGEHIVKRVLQAAHAYNPDGCGFAAATPHGMVVQKGLWGFRKFWKSYRSFEKYPMLVHFRQATTGTVNDDNCHPFVHNGVAFIHNGHFAGFGEEGSWWKGTVTPETVQTKSDTADLFEKLLVPVIDREPDLLFDDAVSPLLSEVLASWTSIIMHPTGKVKKFGRGEWYKGAWYSNLRFLPKPKPDKTELPPLPKPSMQYLPESPYVDDYYEVDTPGIRDIGHCTVCLGLIWSDQAYKMAHERCAPYMLE